MAPTSSEPEPLWCCAVETAGFGEPPNVQPVVPFSKPPFVMRFACGVGVAVATGVLVSVGPPGVTVAVGVNVGGTAVGVGVGRKQ